jgi:hypothetical protein
MPPERAIQRTAKMAKKFILIGDLITHVPLKVYIRGNARTVPNARTPENRGT